VKGKDVNLPSVSFKAGAVVVVPTSVTFAQFAAVSAGATTIPLFVAPAGMRVVDGYLDILTPATPTSGTTAQIGWGSNGQIIAEASVNTVRRLTHSPTTSAVMVSLGVPFAADTTIEFKLSTSGTATYTAGHFNIQVMLYGDPSVTTP